MSNFPKDKATLNKNRMPGSQQTTHTPLGGKGIPADRTTQHGTVGQINQQKGTAQGSTLLNKWDQRDKFKDK